MREGCAAAAAAAAAASAATAAATAAYFYLLLPVHESVSTLSSAPIEKFSSTRTQCQEQITSWKFSLISAKTLLLSRAANLAQLLIAYGCHPSSIMSGSCDFLAQL
jgi:hypothetical protein